MHQGSDSAAARRLVAECCLIAADVDKTILDQTDHERAIFLRHVAPRLLEAAECGMKLAFVTGNSMAQLTERFLKWLLDQVCHGDALELLPQFHFFCSSGGVYFHFPAGDEALAALLELGSAPPADRSALALAALTETDPADGPIIRPRFLDATYLARTQLPAADVPDITRILADCGTEYYARLLRRHDSYARQYDLAKFDDGAGGVIQPAVETRWVRYLDGGRPCRATVQLTLKPVLSFRQGRTEQLRDRLFERDLRTEVIHEIQRRLDASGLGRYVARAGGRASIDVTLGKLDKAYAMEFLIDRLNLRGDARLGQRLGANAIYFGDEVIVGGGNDYPVTRIPGLLVFAVNEDTQLIPFQSNVLVPSSTLRGPEATAEVLGELVRIARHALGANHNGQESHEGNPRHGSAVDALRVKLFRERIEHKIHALRSPGRLSPDEWLALHTLVTLMGREDASARHWISVLVDELDAIMAQIRASRQAVPRGMGVEPPGS